MASFGLNSVYDSATQYSSGQTLHEGGDDLAIVRCAVSFMNSSSVCRQIARFITEFLIEMQLYFVVC